MQAQQSRSHITVEDKYEKIRVNARQDAMSSMPLVMSNDKGQGINLKGEVKLGGIDFKAIVQSKLWDSSPLRRSEITISWTDAARKYSRTVPKRFELAIWHRESFLCGLALGQPTWSGSKLRLDLIEGSPDKNALSGLITDITLIAAEVYADSIGASQLRIMNPINEKVRNHYMRSDRGFSYDKRGDFCYRDL